MIIALVNNMPDGALRATERQFTELLDLASARHAERITLRWISIPEVPRGPAGLAHVRRHYEDVSRLWDERIDGLIVTGAEPKTSLLEEEPYWPTLARLIDWAGTHTTSTIWSCLAAHAAVYRLDGIERRRLPEKLSGIVPCHKGAEHPLVAGMPQCWGIPHSRLNDMPEGALIAAGYRVVSELSAGGVDVCVKEGSSLFVLMQGHPEYECATLLREYQRDIGRFLRGERDDYPPIPSNYFDEAMIAKLEAFQRQVLERRDPELLAASPVAEPRAEPPRSWHEPAVCLYENWLSYIRKCRLTAIALRNREQVPTS